MNKRLYISHLASKATKNKAPRGALDFR